MHAMMLPQWLLLKAKGGEKLAIVIGEDSLSKEIGAVGEGLG